MNAPLPTPPLLAAESDGLHLRRALLRLYVEYLPQNIIVVSVSAAVIGAILLSVVPLLWAAPWIAFQAAMSIYSAARIAAGRRRRARPERAMRATVEERVRRGELIAVSTAALSGASWGALVAYAPFISVEAAAGLMLASGGLAAGSATTMSAVPWAARLFASGCILPTAFYLAAAGLPDSQGLSIVAVTMLLVMLSATSRVNARFVAQIGSERSAKQLLETTQAERERIEAALADSDLRSQRERARRKRAEEVYRSLYENAVFGIYRVSEDLKPLRVNAALAAMHGYASEEEFMAALGADIGREIYADPGRRDEFYRLLRENGRVTNFVSQMYRHKTREAIWVEENGWLVRDADGNVAYEGTTLDVTERVWAIGVIAESEAETKRAKERYELAVEASSTGIWSWDMDGGTIFQTRECRQLIGYADGPEAEEGVYPDTEFIRAIHPEDAIAAKGLLKRIRGANEVDAELRLRCADGAFRWFRLKGRAIRDQDDRIARVAGTLTDIDARKRQQAELRAVKERYELAVAGGKTGIWIWDFDAATIYESRECAILKGRPDDPATAEIVRSEAEYERTMHPDDIHPRNRYRRIVCETGGLDVQLRYLCRDGAYRWFRQMGRAVRGADGRILRVIGSLTDIDERKRQADELRAVKERYELAVAGGRTGIWTWDFDAATLYELRECAILKGLPDDPSTVEVVHSEAEFARMVHPDDLVPPNRLRKMVRETGAIDVELRYKCSDGQYRWFRLKGRAIRGADGRVSSVTGSVTDIDESKRQAADLRTAKERYELAIAASATGIWSWDPAKHLMFESLECRRLLGYAGGEAEVPDANFMAAVHPDDSGPAAAIFDTLRRSGTIDIELRLRTAGGEHRWFRIRGEAVRDRSGRIVRVMGSLTDVDDKVRASRALEIALKAAKASERAKSEFLATMSHEIRTPMNGIIGMADALLDTPLAREQRRMSATIRESGELLLRIINDVLDISKFEAGGVALETAPFDLQPLLGFAVDVVARDARSKGIRIESRLDSALPRHVLGDRARLRQVLLNLLTNAVKFTERGSVTVAVDLVAAQGGAATIAFSVADTGIGIPASILPRLFGDFVQADASIARRYGGTGLGLAISKRIVEKMGGTIAVESREGAGSTFTATVTLPIVAENARESRTEAEIAEIETIEALGELDPPARVLLVEDNATNQQVVRTIVGGIGGVRLDFAEDGGKAVEAAAAGRYDLVLMDLHLPAMDGFEAARAIRAQGGWAATVPIVALTADAFAGNDERCRAAGMNDRLEKPFRRREFIAMLGRYLAPRRAIPRGGNGAGAARQAASQDDAVLDAAVFRSLADDVGEAARATIAGIFLSQLSETVASLRRGNDTAPSRELLRLVHSLKSSAATLGTMVLSRHAAAMEAAMMNGAARHAAADIESLAAIAAETRKALAAQFPTVIAAE